MDEERTRENFYLRLERAPHAAKGFFETIATHFDRRNDTAVKYTRTGGADMRLWAIWTSPRGTERRQVFATLAWKPKLSAVFSRCMLVPAELKLLGITGATQPASPTEPLNSEMRLGEDYWRMQVGSFVRILETARIKLVGV